MTETVYWPGVVELPTVTLRVIVPGVEGVTGTLDLLRAAVIPRGVLGEEKVTVPEKPFRLETVRVEVFDNPWFIVRLAGLGLMLKSGATTLTVTVVEWDNKPLVPVTLTV